MESVRLQGYKHQRNKVLSRWVRITRHYEEHGARATYTKFGISRSGLYYIIGQMNKEIDPNETTMDRIKKNTPTQP